jgi:hypothetical protein
MERTAAHPRSPAPVGRKNRAAAAAFSGGFGARWSARSCAKARGRRGSGVAIPEEERWKEGSESCSPWEKDRGGGGGRRLGGGQLLTVISGTKGRTAVRGGRHGAGRSSRARRLTERRRRLSDSRCRDRPGIYSLCARVRTAPPRSAHRGAARGDRVLPSGPHTSATCTFKSLRKQILPRNKIARK